MCFYSAEQEQANLYFMYIQYLNIVSYPETDNDGYNN